MPKARRQAERLERTREGILDAAAQTFVRRGYNASSMTDIAREAGYSAPTLYTYFKGKEDIFESLVERSLGALLATFDRPVPKGLDFEQRLELLLRAQYDVAEAQRDAFVFLIRLANGLDVGPQKRGPLAEQLRSRSVTWMAQAQADTQQLLHYPPDVLSMTFFSLSHGVLCRWAESAGQEPLPELVPTVLRLFLYGATSQDD